MLKIRKKMGKKGLTLIELLVTIAVLAVVAAIAVPVVGNVINNANEQAVAQTETDIANFTEKYSKTGGYTYDPSTGTFAGYADLNGDGVATEDEKIEEFDVDLDKFSVGSVGGDVPTSAAEIDFDSPVAGSFSIIDYAVTLTPESLTVNGWVNNAISATNVSLDGAQGAITWTISEGTLPTGLTLNPSTGIVTGTPTETYTLDTVVIQATDENGAAVTQSHSYDIAPEPTLTPASVTTEGLVGESLSTANASLNGFTEPYSWEITSGSLPTGLNLDSSTGTISGTPTEAGTSGLTIMLTDANSLTANQTHEFTIEASDLYEFTNATFAISGSLPNSGQGPTISQVRSGLTGTGVDSWKNNTSYLNASSGIIEWTVPADGTYILETWGASGGGSYNDGNLYTGAGNNGTGGRGGYSKGEIDLAKGSSLYIFIGGEGADPTSYSRGYQASGGWNGGGNGNSDSDDESGGGGGGGTAISTSITPYADRIIVAGGGGGAGFNESTRAGVGGGESGTPNTYRDNGGPGTQSSGHALGEGGDADGGGNGGGGGGGGYYGGHAGGSASNGGHGDGGSGYIAGLDNAQSIDGNSTMPHPTSASNQTGHVGNGAVRITKK